MTEAALTAAAKGAPPSSASERLGSPYDALFVSRAIKYRMSNVKDGTTPASRFLREKDANCPCDGDNLSVDESSTRPGASPLLQKLRMTPALIRVREKLETQLAAAAAGCDDRDSKESPGLQRLRATPGRPVQEKRTMLARKHEEVRSRADELNLGGGVTMWPNMDDMRLGRGEFLRLAFVSVLLTLITVVVFWQLHGALLLDLHRYTMDLRSFARDHPIDTSDASSFTTDVLRWHDDFIRLLASIGDRFDTTSTRHTPVTYWLCMLAYITGICILLYYLAENVLSTNKLSPKRVKHWVALLCVIGCWTVLMSVLFVAAYGLEAAVVEAVHSLSEQQRLFVTATHLDTTAYDRLLSYWATRHLSSFARGTLVIFGVLPFQSLVHYVQYYSVPIFTAVLTPVIKLVVSLLQVYGVTAQQQR